MEKLLLQLFAEEEELETTDSNEVEESVDATEEVVEESTEETTETPEKSEKEEKRFTQEEVNSMMQDRLRREKKILDRDYNKELSKYKEIAYLTKEGLKANDLDDALAKTRDFYGKQGIKYTPERSDREENIIANADAQDILDTCETTADIETELNRLLNKGTSISKREEKVSKILIDELNNRNRISSLSKLGVTKEEYDSDKFKTFEKQFTKETPIETIYEMYRMTNKSTKKVDNPGSMKNTPETKKKDYITEAEYDRMTDKEIEENMELIRYSMSKW